MNLVTSIIVQIIGVCFFAFFTGLVTRYINPSSIPVDAKKYPIMNFTDKAMKNKVFRYIVYIIDGILIIILYLSLYAS